MAIVQSSMAEEILSRQERAVIRGIYRASQLAEARNTLQKIIDGHNHIPCSPLAQHGPLIKSPHMIDLIAYLDNAIFGALESTKVPSSVHDVKKIQPASV
jgi:hypothetical protein